MANITVTLYWDMDLRKWTTTLGGTTETDPIQGLVQGDIVKFAVRFVQTGVAVVLAAPVFTASGIKADNDFTGSYLIQLSAPVLSDTTLYTFTVNPLNSANLNTFLQTYRNTWCALEIYDSVNGILTTPLELQITPGYSLSGTPTDNVAGVIVVAAGKTVTFPQSLTFPSALGTNGFQLTTDGAGALTWAAGTNAPGGSTTQVQYNNAGSFAGITGATTDGTALTLVTPVLGAATATSINGITISAGGSGTLTMAGSINTSNNGGDINTSYGGEINTSGNSTSVGGYIKTYGQSTLNGGYIDTHASTANGGFIDTSGENGAGGSIDTHGGGGSINTSVGGGSISTTGTGSIELGVTGTRTTFRGNAATVNKTIDLPNLTGTVVVTAATSATATQALFAQATGFPAYRAIASADIATALTTPGAIGGTTASTGAFTTLSLPTTTSSVGIVKINSSNFLHAYGTANTFLGFSTGNFTLSGANNVGIGYQTLDALAAGAENVGLGYAAGGGLTSGSYNLCIGSQAGASLTTTSSNVIIGYTAASNRTTGSNSITIGSNAQLNVTTGGNNSMVVIGDYAGPSASGNYCTIIGSYAGRGLSAGSAVLTSGASNTLIGNQADVSSATGTYRTVIGAEAVGTANNSVTLGRAADTVILPGGLVTVPEALAPALDAGITVSVAVTATGFALNGTNAATLANGTNGQIKVISCTAVTAAGTATLTPTTSAADYNTIAFTAAGQTATLQYFTTGGWYILSLRGAVAA